MSHSAFTSDPRSIITPDAFEVDRKLLGFPLASPSRRLVAILIDLVIIGLLTTLPGILLGIVGAAVFLRIWGKSEKGDPLARAFKWAMGCFGVFVLFITVIVIVALRTDLFDKAGDLAREAAGEGSAAEATAGDDVLSDLGLGDVIRSVPALVRLRGPMEDLEQAETPDDAQAAANQIAQGLQELGLGRSRIRDALEQVAGTSPAWGDRDPVIDAALASLGPEAGGSGGEAEATPTDSAAPAEPAAVPTLSPRALDSIEVLQSHLADSEEGRQELRRELRDTRNDLDRAREEREQKGSGGFFSAIRGLVDNLGMGFGWGSVYMTIFLAWWKGQTVGKRAMNIRVLRLDGEPIGWFLAFERAGGYAAGFATGLLGFAQVWWDPNRQAIHDKIVGTVVIKDGEDRVPGPWMMDEGREGAS